MTVKILVTGGLGFVGSHIVDRLLSEGHEVDIIDNMSSSVVSKEFFEPIKPFIGDVSDMRFIDSVFSKRKYDCIFHFAANASVPNSINNEDINFSSNVTGTYNILKRAALASSAIILASTSAVYGEQYGEKVGEMTSARPISPYGVSKLIGEELCLAYGRIYGNKVIAFRYFNIYGPRQNRYVGYDFIRKISENRGEVKMLGTGLEIRDFINIKDVVSVSVMPLNNEHMWNEIYNIGSGVGTKIKDLLRVMLEELHETREVTFSGKSWRGDISGLYADIDKIRSMGFEPSVNLHSGIKEFIQSEIGTAPSTK